MSLPISSRLALKEWAVAVKALAKGEQIIILRKGGIHREDKAFRVVHPEFLLFPTYEHQNRDLVRAGSHDDLEQTLAEYDNPEKVDFGYWCEVTDKFEVSEQTALDEIAPYHIWTSDYANKRLRWRPKQPLTIALLRMYALEQPQALPVLGEYGGCKSWVDLAEDVHLGDMTPVLSEDAYEAKAKVIRAALN
ncbi:MAG: DUF1802 family protein [Chloroflexi bacterium]|nr:DUF1802 family protein [Chloroflexota bacterium]